MSRFNSPLRTIRGLTFAAIALALFAAPMRAQTGPRLNGDVNNDGAVTALDAQAVLTSVVGIELPAGQSAIFGDANCDGTVGALDAQIILMSVVKLDVTQFCVTKPAGLVVALVTLDVGSGSVAVGGTLQLTATARDEANAVLAGRTITWTSSDVAKATVSVNGLVTGVAAGSVTITAASEGKTATATVSVVPGGTETIVVTPGSTTVLIDGTVPLTAAVLDVAGNPVTGKTITWSSSSNAVATVGADGIVTGRALGTATITATSGTLVGTATVVVAKTGATPNRTWTGAVSTDWTAAGNWSPAGVPISTDTLSILGSVVNQPSIASGIKTIAGLTIDGNGILTLQGSSELQVTGRVDVNAGSSIAGTGKVNVQGVTTSTSLIRGTFPNLSVSGKGVITGTTTVNGDLEIVSGGSIFDLNGKSVKVTGNTAVNGFLWMKTPSGVLDVRGNIRFFNDAATANTDANRSTLSAGTLKVGGNFLVVVPPSITATPFAPTLAHVVVLDGAAKQIVEDIGLDIVAFRQLRVSNTAGGVEFKTEASKPRQRFQVSGNFTGTTATSIFGEGRLNVFGAFSTAGGSVTLRNLGISGLLAATGSFKPDTLTLMGNVTLPGGPVYDYQQVIVTGAGRFSGPAVIAGNVTLGCVLDASLAPDCASGGALDISGQRVKVNGDIRQTLANASGALDMRTSTDSLVIRGSLLGPIGSTSPTAAFTSGNWTGGYLHVGKNMIVTGAGAGIDHRTFLEGTVEQLLQPIGSFSFGWLTVSGEVGVVVDGTVAPRKGIVGVKNDFNISSASKLTGIGRMVVAGRVSTATGSSVELGALSVGSTLSADGLYLPDTAEFNSPSQQQTIQDKATYRNILVSGLAIFGGSNSISGSLIVLQDANLNMGKRHVTVAKDISVAGLLRMQEAADTLTVLGNAQFSRADDASAEAYVTNGVLRVAGTLTGARPGGFYPSGAHKVVLIGTISRAVSGTFQNLEVANTDGASISLTTVRGTLSTSVPVTLLTLESLTVDGSVVIAKPATIKIPLAKNVTVKTDFTASDALTITNDGNLRIVGSLSSTAALTTNSTVTNNVAAGRTTVLGNFSNGAESSVGGGSLAIKGTITTAGVLAPARLILLGARTLAAGSYKAVQIAGQVIAGGNLTFDGTLFVDCDAATTADFPCGKAAPPSLNVNGKAITVNGHLLHTIGQITMTQALDSLMVRDSVRLGNVVRRTFAAGVLRIGGHLASTAQDGVGANTDTAAVFGVPGTTSFTLGTKVVFNGTVTQNVSSPVNLRFSDVDISNPSTAGVVFLLPSTEPGNARHIVFGSMSVASLTVTSSNRVEIRNNLTLKDGARLNTTGGVLIYGATYAEEGTVALLGEPRLARLKTVKWVTQPTATTNRIAFSPVIAVELVDSLGARMTGGSAPIDLDNTGAILVGKTRVITVNGLATFTGVAPAVSGTGLVIKAVGFTPGIGRTEVASSSFNVTAAAAAKIAISTQPVGTTANVNFTTQPVVVLQDANGGLASADNGQMTVALDPSSMGAGTLSGILTVTITNGTATFTGLKITAPGTYKLSFTSPTFPAFTAVVSNALVLDPLPATSAVVTTEPVGGATGVVLPTQPVIELRDSQGARASGSTLAVTATITTVTGATGTLGGTTTVNAVGGVATFTNLVVSGIGTYRLTFAPTGLTPVTSANFTTVAGEATKLTMKTQPVGTTNNAVFSPQPAVELRTAIDGLASGSTNPVTASIATGPTGAILYGTPTVNAVGGIATFTGLRVSHAGTYTFNFTSPGLTSVISGSVVVTQLAPSHSAITTQPGTAVTGSPLSVQPILEVRDGSGLRSYGATTSITATLNTKSGGPGTLSGITTVSAVDGIATFTNLTVTGVGTYTISFASTFVNVVSVESGQFTISPLPATKLAITQQPTSAIANATFTTFPVVQTRNSSDGVVSTSGVPITVAIVAGGTGTGTGTLTGTTTVNTTNGSATFSNLKISSPGTYNLAFTSPNLATANATPIEVTVGPAAKLVVLTPPTTTLYSGSTSPTAPVIEIQDAAGNRVTTATNTVVATSPTAASLTGTTSVNAVAGLATFSNLYVAGQGSHTLQFTSNALTATTGTSVTLIPTTLKLVTQPRNYTTGIPVAPALTIQVLDPSLVVVPTANNIITALLLSAPIGTMTGTAVVTAVNGVATFSNLVITPTSVPATGYSLRWSSPGSTLITSQTFNIYPKAATIAITTAPSSTGTSNTALAVQPKVTFRTSTGATLSTAVDVTATLDVITGPGGTLGGTTVIAAVNGVASFTDLKITGAGTYKITFTTAGVTPVQTTNTIVIP